MEDQPVPVSSQGCRLRTPHLDEGPLSRDAAIPILSLRVMTQMLSTKPLISVVDDDLSVCRALRRLIQSAGYTVETLASTREFLDSSPEGRPACLVLDIHLGGDERI